MTGRYLPPCDRLAGDQRAREGAVSLLHRAKQEAAKHLALAVQSFQHCDISAGVAAARAALAAASQGQSTTGMGASPVAATGANDDDDDLGYSEEEGCMPEETLQQRTVTAALTQRTAVTLAWVQMLTTRLCWQRTHLPVPP